MKQFSEQTFFDTSLGTCRKISKILEIVCSIRNFDKWYEEKMEFVVGRKNDVNWINDDEFWHKKNKTPRKRHNNRFQSNAHVN